MLGAVTEGTVGAVVGGDGHWWRHGSMHQKREIHANMACNYGMQTHGMQ